MKLKALLLYPLFYITKLFNINWNTFYSWLLNNIERKNKFEQVAKQDRKHGFYSLSKGEEFLKVLTHHGLKKNMNFLDFGCGYGRIGIPVINYLNKNRYIGLDLSRERIRLAKEYLSYKSLDFKKATFFCSHNKNLKDLVKGKKFDFILIYTVICHNPLKEVKEIISSVKPYLKKKGFLLFDYIIPSDQDYYLTVLGKDISLSVKDYRHTDKEINEILNSLNMKSKLIQYKKKKGYDWQLNNKIKDSKRFIIASLKK